MKLGYKIIIGIVIAGLLFLIGYIIGKKTTVPEKITEIKYIKGDPIIDSIPYPVPIEVTKPIDTASIISQAIKDGVYTELFPTITVIDSIYIPTQIDTSKILVDWSTKRTYTETLFDSDTSGTCIITTNVQYNRMYNLKYNYTPSTKTIETTIKKVPLFSPFIGVGFGTDNIGTIMAGGFFQDHYGVAYQYQRLFNTKSNNHSLLFVYKF